MKHLRPAMTKTVFVLLVVTMLMATLGLGVASAANTTGGPITTSTISTAAPRCGCPEVHKVQKNCCGCVYRVQRGDSLSRIAMRYHTTVWSLASLNGIRNPNRIFAGSWLRVPCCPEKGRW